MTSVDRRERSSIWANALLTVASVVLTIAAAEALVRALDGQPIFAFPMPDPIGSAPVKPEELDKLSLAAGVERSWFYDDPPPLPNRQKPPAGWVKLYEYLQDHWPTDTEFRPTDVFKAWNAVFAGDPCQHRFLRLAPGRLFVYQPPEPIASPPYRFQPNVTQPDHLVTNQIGWRGRPIEFPRRPRTVRIVFVGASTTVDGHGLPFSHSEFVGHWLDLWAAAHHPDIHFEVLNAGRESNVSTDIANIVRNEVLPLRPDLVVYYEGSNQFRPASIVDKVPAGAAARPPRTGAKVLPQWLRSASRYSALMARIASAIGYAASNLDGREWPKPDYKVVWPPGLSETDPDLSYPNLPVTLNVILHDLDRIRGDLASIDAELALSSFIWIVKDGMVLDPIRHRYILEELNVANYPFRYRELERLAKFQNRAFAKYASTHGLAFLDVASHMPFDPDLFEDAIHATYSGVRLHGWIDLQLLLPVIEKHLADGSWPRPAQPDLPLPTFQPKEITFDCEAPR
jgi:hypothetical protein